MTLTTIEAINEAVTKAENEIYLATGMPVRLLYEVDLRKRQPEMLLQVIAKALDMQYEDFKTACRKREYTELRYIGAKVIKDYFPKTLQCEIGRMFNQDHTAIGYALGKYSDLIATNEEFKSKYNRVLNIVTQWICD